MEEIVALTTKVINGYALSRTDAINILNTRYEDIPLLMGCAFRIKNHFLGNKVRLCAIVNAKSGNCSEDCAFCAQSNHSRASVTLYPLISAEEMFRAAKKAYSMRASCFGIVTSGKSIIPQTEIDTIARGITLIKSRFPDMDVAVSIGTIPKKNLTTLMDAGLTTVHHNIETSPSYFKKICSTHSYEEKLDFIKMLPDTGVKMCSGGIIGMGESNDDRIDFAFTVRSLNAYSVPLNFLSPLPGTRLEHVKNDSPLDMLKIVSLFRFLLPDTLLQICGGREVNFRTVQSALFLAGASGMMTGNYLTTTGQDPTIDLQMMSDLDLVV